MQVFRQSTMVQRAESQVKRVTFEDDKKPGIQDEALKNMDLEDLLKQ